MVELNDKFDIGKILAESGINPGKSFSGKTIMTAIEAVTGKTPGYQSYGFATPLSMWNSKSVKAVVHNPRKHGTFLLRTSHEKI